MSALNRQTFRPGQLDYAALAQEDMADLMPPSIRAELSGQFQEAGQEVTGDLDPAAEDLAREKESGERDGNGSAVFDGAPKPVPGDELAATVYSRAPDERSDIGLMTAAGAAYLASQDNDRPEIETPAPEAVQQQQDPLEGMEPSRGNYRALDEQHAAVIDNNDLSDLMPANAREDVAAGFSPAAQEMAGQAPAAEADDMADLMPPDIRAEVDQANSYQQGQQQSQSLGL